MAQSSGLSGFDQVIRHFGRSPLGISRHGALQAVGDMANSDNWLTEIKKRNLEIRIGQLDYPGGDAAGACPLPPMSRFKYVTRALSGQRSPVVSALEVTRI